MTFAFSKCRPRIRAACRSLGLAAALISMSSVAHATNYAETVSGDLSSDPANPTSIGELTLGNNEISGATIPSGPLDPVTHSRPVVDNDYFTFTVPTGDVLSSILIDPSTEIQSTDRLFFGIAKGTYVSVDPSFTSADGLLGWSLIGSSMIGKDALPALGLSAPANFPAIGGATGFKGSLGAGAYTVWLLDGDSPVTYKLDLRATSAPEPATWAMMLTGFGLMGATLRRRTRRHLTTAC